MRLFVAIFPPAEIQSILAESKDTLSVEGNAKWTRPENIHLTLKFLGEVTESEVESVSNALGKAASRHSPLDLTISGFGGFPSERKARVLWAGLGGETSRLRRLAEDIEDIFEALGFEREKRGFSPHLTLARAKKKAMTLEVGRKVEVSGFEVEKIQLVKSETRREGALYTPLEVYPLTNTLRGGLS